jgi:outer membrane protein TolC
MAAVPVGLAPAFTPATGVPPGQPLPPGPPGTVYHLTLDEARQRVLGNSELLELAAQNIKSKEYATRAVQANYFPQIIGASVYTHFNDDLGEVLQFKGKTFRGPLDKTFLTIPSNTVAVALTLQDNVFTTINVVQPITDLLKVR